MYIILSMQMIVTVEPNSALITFLICLETIIGPLIVGLSASLSVIQSRTFDQSEVITLSLLCVILV